jgi:hypothetical protein
MWSKLMKYYLIKIDTSQFHQRLPNMVQRLFADVRHDAIWFMNIHEQNHPWFLAMLHFPVYLESFPLIWCPAPLKILAPPVPQFGFYAEETWMEGVKTQAAPQYPEGRPSVNCSQLSPVLELSTFGCSSTYTQHTAGFTENNWNPHPLHGVYNANNSKDISHFLSCYEWKKQVLIVSFSLFQFIILQLLELLRKPQALVARKFPLLYFCLHIYFQ